MKTTYGTIPHETAYLSEKTTDPTTRAPFVVSDQAWQIEDVLRLAAGDTTLQLSQDARWQRDIDEGAAFLQERWREDGVIYGVTTGYGASYGVSIPPELVESLPLHLTRFHGCGLGAYLDAEATRAVIAVRICSLAKGFSGVRLLLLQRLADLLHHDMLPLIPEEGSVGASGDLTPLSYLAAALVGERKLRYQGQIIDAAEAWRRIGIEPITLQPKEGLALMNGTAVMTALACQAFARATYLARLSSVITGIAATVLQSHPDHFHPRLFAVKPYPGQEEIAARIRATMPEAASSSQLRLQAHYSIRCAPHIIGVLADALPWMRQHIEIELNSANDNPIIDAKASLIHHGGHFYGGHIAFVMDSLKNAVANLADLLDRQMALLVDPRTNAGLPANLSGATGQRAAIHHGLKAVQIGASAWAAEALKLTMPASVFSRSTECHNQDKVSMGTIAARDALRILTLTEQVCAAMLLSISQAVALRTREAQRPAFPKATEEFLVSLAALCPFLEEDQPLESTLRALVEAQQKQHWSFDSFLCLSK